MTTLSEKVKVQQALVALGRLGDYYKVSYDPTTNSPVALDKDDVSLKVTPQWVGANELSAEFVRDDRYGRREVLRRAAWSWALQLRFPCEVTVEAAEDAWTSNPSVVLRDPPNGLTRQVTLLLVRSQYDHPTTQEGSHPGSQITFFFEARLSRA